MTERLQVYKCEICGNIVEVIHGGQGELVCCGKPMKLLKEQRADSAKEKHVPVVEAAADGVTVKVGSIPHPMETEHYIEWVQIMSGDNAYRIFLKPGGAPEGTFKVLKGDLSAREYCNVHGLWRS
ncbi:MAG: desulfoferrodoxin [bacterium]|jgi:superoxide reductase